MGHNETMEMIEEIANLREEAKTASMQAKMAIARQMELEQVSCICDLMGIEKLYRIETYIFALTMGQGVNSLAIGETWQNVTIIRNAQRELRQQIADFIGAKLR